MFVERAEMDSPVRSVIVLERVTMTSVATSPTEPSTQLNLKYITTPMIVRMFGVNTPWNVPKL